MNNNWVIGWLVIVASFAASCAPSKYVYPVNKIAESIVLDGIADEEVWQSGISLSDFIYPWNDDLECPETTFKCVSNDEFLYFYYYAADDDIRLKQSGDEEMDAVASDRVEIFIRSSDTTKPYYAFEMDPQGRVFDSKGEFGKYIDKEYDFPRSDFDFVGNINADSYTLEGKFRLSTLREMGLIIDDTILVGLFRGEYLLDDEGKEKTYWISWVSPDSTTPNFHIPSSFGKLKLQ